MARTGRGKNARRSDMPAMTSELVEKPMFEYLNLIERHRWSRPVTPGPPMPGLGFKLVPSIINVSTGINEPAACWPCPGCGKTLVSAVHNAWQPPVGMYCTRACREAHA